MEVCAVPDRCAALTSSSAAACVVSEVTSSLSLSDGQCSPLTTVAATDAISATSSSSSSSSVSSACMPERTSGHSMWMRVFATGSMKEGLLCERWV